MTNIYREEVQMNKNNFCIRPVVVGNDTCGATHRNGNKPKININETLILIVIPRKDMAFMQPIGSTKKVLPEDLSEWLDKENTLDEWNHLLFFPEVADSGNTINARSFKSLEDFIMKHSLIKTPNKKRKEETERPSHVTSSS